MLLILQYILLAARNWMIPRVPRDTQFQPAAVGLSSSVSFAFIPKLGYKSRARTCSIFEKCRSAAVRGLHLSVNALLTKMKLKFLVYTVFCLPYRTLKDVYFQTNAMILSSRLSIHLQEDVVREKPKTTKS